mmetsp:Transcript_34532/g.40640  ORF Transcript_34532/g.40640 Transcript_34532/m.40640 type:complete len:92 (+) Transcript_34532:100-375(+)
MDENKTNETKEKKLPWHVLNKERHRENCRRWREANKQKHNDYCKNWVQNNRTRYNENHRLTQKVYYNKKKEQLKVEQMFHVLLHLHYHYVL